MTQTTISGTQKSIWERLFPYFLVTPTLIFVLVFTVLPSIRTINDSFYEPGRRASQPSEFVGLENYQKLFDENHHIGSQFTLILGNTIAFAFLTVLIGVPLSLLMALLLNRKMRFLGFWRFSVFYPSLLPLLGAASIWSFLYADTLGLF